MTHDDLDDVDDFEFPQAQTQAERELLAAIRAVGDGPCGACPLRERCASEPAACQDYMNWLETGVVDDGARFPTRDLFDFIENIVSLDIPSEMTHQRNQVLRALLAEARQGVEFRIRAARPRQIRSYKRWLETKGVSVGPRAIQRLLQRTERAPRDLAFLHRVLGGTS